MKTKEQRSAYAGVDISKDRLDVSLAGQGPSHYTNSALGIEQLIMAELLYEWFPEAQVPLD